MSARGPLHSARRALPITFLIYVVEALLASFAALPLGSELARARFDASDASSMASLLESSDQLLALLRGAGIELTIGGAVLLLITPWLRMSWLVALSEGQSTFAALERGGQLFARAWLVSLGVLLLFLLGCSPFLGAAYLLHEHYDAGAAARTHDIALLAALSPIALLFFGACLLHDLAHARALSDRCWVSVRASLAAVLRPRVLGYSFVFALLGWLVIGLPQAVAGPLSQSSLGVALLTALFQGCALAKLFARSVWLACAHAQIAPPADHARLGERSKRTKHESVRA